MINLSPKRLTPAIKVLAVLGCSTLMPMQSAWADEPGTDPNCYDEANAGAVGQADWTGCAGMYIITGPKLTEATLEGNKVNHDGVDYTFGDSAHNIFTGQVMGMGYLFSNSDFNEDISYWDTSKVTDMEGMFMEATAFNQDLSEWNVKKIPDEPSSFDEDIKSEWADAKHPKWGTAGGEAKTTVATDKPADPKCYDAANAKIVGKAGWIGCSGMYIASDKTDLEARA